MQGGGQHQLMNRKTASFANALVMSAALTLLTTLVFFLWKFRSVHGVLEQLLAQSLESYLSTALAILSVVVAHRLGFFSHVGNAWLATMQDWLQDMFFDKHTAQTGRFDQWLVLWREYYGEIVAPRDDPSDLEDRDSLDDEPDSELQPGVCKVMIDAPIGLRKHVFFKNCGLRQSLRRKFLFFLAADMATRARSRYPLDIMGTTRSDRLTITRFLSGLQGQLMEEMESLRHVDFATALAAAVEMYFTPTTTDEAIAAASTSSRHLKRSGRYTFSWNIRYWGRLHAMWNLITGNTERVFPEEA